LLTSNKQISNKMKKSSEILFLFLEKKMTKCLNIYIGDREENYYDVSGFFLDNEYYAFTFYVLDGEISVSFTSTNENDRRVKDILLSIEPKLKFR